MGRRRRAISRGGVPAACLAVTVLGAHTAAGQAVERHLPPAPQAIPPPVAVPAPLGASEDARPIAGPLDQIVTLGLDDPVLGPAQATGTGVDVSRIAAGDRGRVAAALRPFFGKVVSRRLIGEIEAAVVRAYRKAGRPLVSVTTPPQEIGGGRLQLRITPYHLGRQVVRGASGPAAVRIEGGVRVAAGQPIETDVLAQDLDWLDRYPFRTAAAAFAPGVQPGDTDLVLTVTPSRPFRAYAGWSDSGSPATGRDRYVLGALVGLPLPVPTLLSYQITAGPEALHRFDDLLGAGQPEYLSHSARITSFIAPRQDLELTLDFIQTATTTQAFETRSRILEATLAYRFALSNLLPPSFRSAPGDLVLGVEAKGETRATYFGDAVVTGGETEIYQLYGGWSGGWTDPLGRATLDVAVHGSPGGISPENSAAAFQALSHGRVASATYAYATFDLVHTVDLPLGFTLSDEAIGLYGARALPDTEQAGIGGPSLVRGYSLDDGAYDRTLVVRNTLALPWPGRAALGPLAFDRPFLFGDMGWGQDQGLSAVGISSVGVGAGLRLGPAALAVDVGDPLSRGPATRPGHAFTDVRLTVGF